MRTQRNSMRVSLVQGIESLVTLGRCGAWIGILIFSAFSDAAFTPMRPDFSLPSSARLKGAEALGIPYSAFSSQEVIISQKRLLTFKFGKISSIQFAALKNRYGFGQTRVPYQVDREYELADFLTPKMQALINTRFRMEQLGRSNDWVCANCWGTAYEVLREGLDLDLFLGGRSSLEVFRDARYSTVLKPVMDVDGCSKEFVSEFEAGLQFGDLVLLWGGKTGRFFHAAVFIDEGIYFQKGGANDNWPFQLSDDLFVPSGDSRAVINYAQAVRVGGAGKLPFPRPRDVLSIQEDSKGRRFAYAEIPILIPTAGPRMGYGSLPLEAEDKKHFYKYTRRGPSPFLVHTKNFLKDKCSGLLNWWTRKR